MKTLPIVAVALWISTPALADQRLPLDIDPNIVVLENTSHFTNLGKEYDVFYNFRYSQTTIPQCTIYLPLPAEPEQFYFPRPEALSDGPEGWLQIDSVFINDLVPRLAA